MLSGAPALRSVIDGATRFLGWWRDELWGLVPERVRRLLVGTDAVVVLAQVDGGFQVLAGSGTRGQDAAAVLARAEALSALAEMAGSRRLGAVGIRLPASQCFERRVELPRAGRDDVRRMLNFDLERATPFRPGDVYTAYLTTNATAAKGKQRVRQLVVKREVVDPLIADVKAAGLEPAFVDCWQDTPSSGLPVNFLEASEPPRSARAVTLPKALAVLALLLAGLAFALSLSRYESALAAVKAQTAKMRSQATAVRGALERADAAIAGLRRLQRMKLGQIPAVEVLEELSKVLPDSVWLAELRIEGDVLDIAGLAKSGASLPALFVRSALFADASLTAPVTLDPREDKERFNLRVRIRQRGASLPAAANGERM
jgi:general secretion pathway protein L